MRLAAMAFCAFLMTASAQAESYIGVEHFSRNEFAEFNSLQLNSVSDYETAISGFLAERGISAPDALERELAREAYERSGRGRSPGDSIGDLFANRYPMRLLTNSAAADLYVDDVYYERVSSERYLVNEGVRSVRVEVGGPHDCKRNVLISRNGPNKMECYFNA